MKELWCLLHFYTVLYGTNCCDSKNVILHNDLVTENIEYFHKTSWFNFSNIDAKILKCSIYAEPIFSPK